MDPIHPRLIKGTIVLNVLPLLFVKYTTDHVLIVLLILQMEHQLLHIIPVEVFPLSLLSHPTSQDHRTSYPIWGAHPSIIQPRPIHRIPSHTFKFQVWGDRLLLFQAWGVLLIPIRIIMHLGRDSLLFLAVGLLATFLSYGTWEAKQFTKVAFFQ